MNDLAIQFKRVHPDAPAPQYHTAGAAAFDFALVEDVEIPPNGLAKVRTGLIICLPEGHTLIIAARSSSPIKRGVNVANGVGIVDSDYCGPQDEIHILLQNLTSKTVRLSKGDRVAQGMIVPISRASFKEVDEITAKSRGGFGSTGE
ncbi:dUTP diphosphatase [Patescibacteria group bacterium]|nr:dUTP diphosphatase [Patescibacteria group bacterium]